MPRRYLTTINVVQILPALTRRLPRFKGASFSASWTQDLQKHNSEHHPDHFSYITWIDDVDAMHIHYQTPPIKLQLFFSDECLCCSRKVLFSKSVF